ncbi:MAG TPA: DUF1295 domain-containing protein [Bacteroidales bacterium]|nr:DUF1295 domain-containing protein [Bacteroidales bacterium]HNS46311.1 DUF1295 domain-containing protein [Bacteroidales bacterium]
MLNKRKKIFALIVCAIAYLATLVICYLLTPLVDHLHPLMAAAILDGVATVFIFGFSVAFNNSSFYDPYWSVAPVPVILYWMGRADPGQVNSLRQYLILSLVIIWAVRLTWNWIRRWNGFADEDWRYAGLRKKYGNLYWIVSFFGFHLFPTIIVFLGLVSVYPAITMNPAPITVIDLIAGIMTILAIVLETAADEQLRRFIQSGPTPGSFLQKGLWKHSRHPNYLGEVSFWAGLFMFSLGSHPFQWWYLAGPVAMILLFRFISVPMIDARMSDRKTGYDHYIAKTPAIFPWPPKK